VSAAAIGIVLTAAILHATWNALAKRSGDPLAFIWAASALALPLYALPFAVAVQRSGVPGEAIPFVLLSAVFHIAYYLLLARAYNRAELTFAYPVARGTGLLLVPLLAVPIFGDRPTAAGWLGIALVAAGVLWLHAPLLRLAARSEGGWTGVLTGPATLTGLSIAAYSLNDSAGVDRMAPLPYLYLTFILLVLGLAPLVLLRHRPGLDLALSDRRTMALGAAGIFGTYALVLLAMRLAPVSYVVPMRELSIVVGAVIGWRFLGETLGPHRLAGALLVAAGVLAIALGG
jgi:drug/metabolite transporter (DMT)-like permease